MRLLANDGIDSKAKIKLEEMGVEVDTNHYDGDELVENLRKSNVVVIRSATKIRKELIDMVKGSNLKLIIRAGVGIDNIDHEYAKSVGIDVTNTPSASSEAVAELALAHILILARNLHKANRSVAEGKWLKKEYKGTEIPGKTLGLIGFGRISKALARKASSLGMNIIYNRRSGRDENFDEYRYVDFDTLLKESDYISLHIPKTSGEALIGKREFEMMKDSAYLINTARGGLVDEKALVEALEDGVIAGAALDVFTDEPLENEEIYNCNHISFSPHIGASTKEAQSRIGDNIISIIEERFYGDS